MPLRASLYTSHSKPPAISRASVWRLAPSPVAYTRKPQIKMIQHSHTGPSRSYLLHTGGEALDTLDDLACLDFQHFGQLCLGALRRASAQVAFAAFGAYHFAGPGQAKTLGRRLVGLQLGLRGLSFTRHSCLLLSDKIRSTAFFLNHDFTLVFDRIMGF